MTNEELFQELLDEFGSGWMVRFCKVRSKECELLYENNTYESDEILYDKNFWSEKEQYLLDVVTNELLEKWTVEK